MQVEIGIEHLKRVLVRDDMIKRLAAVSVSVYLLNLVTLGNLLHSLELRGIL